MKAKNTQEIVRRGANSLDNVAKTSEIKENKERFRRLRGQALRVRQQVLSSLNHVDTLISNLNEVLKR